jgi:hypothetical protein
MTTNEGNHARDRKSQYRARPGRQCGAEQQARRYMPSRESCKQCISPGNLANSDLELW